MLTNDTNWSLVSEIRVGEMKVGGMKVGGMRVGEMRVGEMRRPPIMHTHCHLVPQWRKSTWCDLSQWDQS